MAFTLSDGLRDREYEKFLSTGSEGAMKVILYGQSGAVFLPVRVLNDGTVLTSGA